MKKIVLMSLMTLSGGLLGTQFPNGQQSTQQTPTQGQVSLQRPRSPQEQPVLTTGSRITERAGSQVARMFHRSMQRTLAEMNREENITDHENNDSRQTRGVMTASQQHTTTIAPQGATVRRPRPRPSALITEHSGDTGALVAPRAQDDDETNR